MSSLILMRHGNTFEEGQTPVQVGARTDLPLTDCGKKQAALMAQYLKSTPPRAIFSGNLQRQIESANIIAKAIGLEVQPSSALMEIDYGLWERLSAEDIDQRWPKEYAEWSKTAKWQEHIFQGSYDHHLELLQKWLDDLRVFFANQTVLAVTSQGILRLFKSEKVKTGHFCRLFLKPNEVEIISWNESPI